MPRGAPERRRAWRGQTQSPEPLFAVGRIRTACPAGPPSRPPHRRTSGAEALGLPSGLSREAATPIGLWLLRRGGDASVGKAAASWGGCSQRPRGRRRSF